ncbi:hypothetical protein ACPRNU_19735 [Chromobacterium vaccinii]|uniref:hypothetical protein n=1 Tax=Chromobacterium vaccinii TaxID=1108595 RepID=UPI003C71107B
MRKAIAAATLLISSLGVATASAGVSIDIGQPGFYGRLDIGNYPPPQVISAQPVIVQPGYGRREPIYLRVPPGHAKHWKRYCRRYGACGERVLFVRDDWYRQVYAPRYREHHRGPHGGHHHHHHRHER